MSAVKDITDLRDQFGNATLMEAFAANRRPGRGTSEHQTG